MNSPRDSASGAQQMINFCCMGFEGNYGNTGKRGLCIYLREMSKGKAFFLQVRLIEAGLEPTVKSEGPLSLTHETGIAFCPWCGVDLKKQYWPQMKNMVRFNPSETLFGQN